jgi:Bifunctional DNA primase/polymerase, N-terminal
MLEFALRYAALGFFIFPLHPIRRTPDGSPRCSCRDPKCTNAGKHPAIRWKAGATRDVETVRTWWSGRFRGYGIGCATGPSGLVVFDADGPKGIMTLGELTGGAWLVTPRVKTSRGWHVFFAAPGDNNRQIPSSSDPDTKLDVRATGGFVVLPPSPHASGVNYTWEAPPWGDSAPLEQIPMDFTHSLRARNNWRLQRQWRAP